MTVLEGPLLKFLKVHSAALVDLEATEYETFQILRDRDVRFELDWNFGHLFDEFSFGFTFPWGLTVEHFIDHYSNGPYIVLNGVDVALEGFRRHIKRAANVVLLLF